MSAAFSSAGTIAYMASERFSKDNTPIMANDIYSLGATVFEMLTGDTPFGDDGGLIQMKGAEVPELKGDFSPQLKEVISRCLRSNPWERPTAEQLEKYAEDGLNGRKIIFVGDKTFWDKYKWFILSGIIILVISSIASSIVIKKQNEERQAMIVENQTKAYNDSIKSLIETQIILGDSLAYVGALHEEGYEVALLEAYQYYTNASSYKFKDGQSLNNSTIEQKLKNIETQLVEAYTSFKEKEHIFSEEDDVALA